MAEPALTPAYPSVTVVIATYNRAHLIGRAIESVIAQTYPDWELIVVDDGSTDGTRETVARFADPRIIYHFVEHGERSRARNLGIALGRGRYVAFLDSDDWYMPHKLAVQVAAMKGLNGGGIVLGGWRIVDPSGRTIRQVRPWEEVSEPPSLQEWLFGTTSTPITVLVANDWLEQVAGFDLGLDYSEDTDLCIRLSMAGCPVAWTREDVAVVLAHESNSLRNWSKSRAGRLCLLDKFFSNADFTDKFQMSKQEVYARFHLAFAMQAYDVGLAEQAKQELATASELYPAICDQNWLAIRRAISDYAHYFLVSDPAGFLGKVFADLPPFLRGLAPYRGQLLGQRWMSQAWIAHREGDAATVRRMVLRAARCTPSSLANRGTVSILAQSIVGPRLWHMARQARHGAEQ